MISTVMWKNLAKQAKTITKNHPFLSSSRTLGLAHQFVPNYRFSYSAYGRIRPQEYSQGIPSLCFLRNQIGANGVFCRSYGGAAEAVPAASSSTEGEEDGEEDSEEIKELLKEMKKAEKCELSKNWRIRRIADFGMQDRKYNQLRKRQLQMETEAWDQAANDYKELLSDMCAHKLAPNLPYMKSLILGWFEPLCDAITREQEIIKHTKPGKSLGHGKHFDLLPVDKMALITMHKLMALLMSGNGSVRVITAVCEIGEAIEQEVRIHKFLEKTEKKKGVKNKENEVEFDAGLNEQDKVRKCVDILMKKQNKKIVNKIIKRQDDSEPWGMAIRAKVGSRLVELFIETAYLQPPASQLVDAPPDIRPAFVRTIQSLESTPGTLRKRFGVIQCDPLILKDIEKTARHLVITYMPMLVPPVKWTGYARGAHLMLPSQVMRTHGSKHQRVAITRAPKKQLESVYEALNALGSTKWRVNNSVLSVVERIWSSGGCLAGLVDRTDIPLPIEPDTDDEVLLKQWKWAVRKAKRENMERHSQRCDTELKLAVARKMKNEEAFYYPHNIDFRGRAYPMHPYLNHLGSDICRGILEFAEGRVLGKSGLRWLKIHMANLYAGGVDKLPLEGRIAFTESHLSDIFDSADMPLEGRRWWLNAEDPFQCLALCINLAEALRSPSPETFVSHIPVHQDGSCNGLQHYAALGRDKLGAAAVNLIAGEKPADVYSGIAARVRDIMRKDAEKDPESFPDALNAKILIDQVDRKLVKQTVMTSVYGVTYIGARDQIKKRLRERCVIEDEQRVFSASCYAARVVLTALGEMFESARSIMGWLGDCAKVIARQNKAVCWTSPIGLPAVQPYLKSGKLMVRTSLQTLTLKQETNKIMSQRQKTAFPPNFVHSLDSSHMMMTALACRKAGINFAGVHDSYWTHACDVDEMNRILREKFVELYDKPILEDVLASFKKSNPGLDFPPLPDRGDFNLKDVLESPYFFN